jgi:signal transduction histidine kinase
MRWTRPSGLTLLSAALLVLLPTLAVLQYRWVGQVSLAERERMQRNLRNAAIQFRDSFDVEVGRAFAALQVGANTARDGFSEPYSDRYEAWVATAEYPEIVADVFLIDAPDGTLRARQWDAARHAFFEVESGWPAPLASWLPEFERQLADFDPAPFGRRGPFPAFADDEMLLVAPLRNFGPPREPGPPPPPVFGYTVVQLDRQFIVDDVLPALSRQFFIHSEGDSYRVAVVKADQTETVIYQSNPEMPVHADSADATQAFFGPRASGFFGRRGGGREGGGGFGPPPPGPRGDGPGPPPNLGRWLVAVQHASGSLEAAVASVRRRNLGISFGVLLLLSVSVALLAQASRRAQRLARLQMEFVAGVSHELRTPIAVIRSAAENLSQGVVGGSDRVKQYGRVMEGEARRLGDMLESVLQYAGVESGRGLGPLAPLAPADLIDQAIESARVSANSSAEVERVIPPELPAIVGDHAALKSAIQNLVVNAFKYGGNAQWVGVRAEQVTRGRKSEVHITVEDRGPGIPAQELPHIFEPFYRGAYAVGEQIHGNGLGLSLVQRIVRAHGGSVSVRARESGGTAFTIVLPAAALEPNPTSLTNARAAAH